MKLSLFDYDLPPELVAQFPARKRDESRLMVLDRSSTDTEILPFKRILDYPQKGDALVVNNTKPAARWRFFWFARWMKSRMRPGRR
jgi:S-adenosylmethionine:tRNA ribosyltransferase-isomerase